MDAKKVTAIVTRAVPYGDADMILTLVSVEDGKLTVTAKSCLKPKAKLRYATEPMNFGEYMLAGKPERLVLADCAQIDSFSPITLDIEKYYSATLILEGLQKLSLESNPSLFMHAISVLKAMAYEGKSAEDAVADFFLYALADNGYQVNFSNCGSCGCIIEDDAVFSEKDGIVCPHCAEFKGVVIDSISRKYISGEDRDIPSNLKTKANMILADIIGQVLGL
ncbi:MAG: DNA repair protein RecO, partial [Clostridia bacterium]|nr:DNA repair protein RecO [Clostridia bacterium]